MKGLKQFVSLLLVLVMVLGCIPSMALAADEGTKYEAESASVAKSGTWTINDPVRSDAGLASGGKFYFNQDSQVGNTLTFAWSEDLAAGTYQVYIKTKDNKDRGIFQFSSGGQNIGSPVDLYEPEDSYTSQYGSYREHEVGIVTHTGGTFTLTAAVTGSNSAATGKNGIALDYIRLVEAAPVETTYEAENLTVTPSGNWAVKEARTTSDSACSGGKFYLLQGSNTSTAWDNVKNNSAAFALGEVASGTYQVYITTKDNPDRGKFQFSAGGKVIGEADLYNTSSGTYVEHNLGFVSHSGGAFVLEAKLTGQNASATGKYGMVLDFIRLVRIGDEGQEPTYETVIWNDEDTGIFTASGSWSPINGIGQDSSNAQKTTDVEATAAWSAYPPKTGNFSLYYWNPAQQDGDGTRAPLRFSVSSQDGNWRFSVDPNENMGSWVKIGTVTATAGTALSVVMSLTKDGTAYADAIKVEETTAAADEEYVPGPGGSTEPSILVNQIGYDIGASKRATAVNIAGGTQFQIINAATGQEAYRGTVEEANTYSETITGGIIDFTAFDQSGSYYIKCGESESYQFEIGKNLVYLRSVENALQFMEETRNDAFQWGLTSFAWRDSHQFSFEMNTLALQYMANPALYDNICGSVYKVEECEYPELRTQAADEPNIVWLMKFAATRYYDWAVNDGKKLHMLSKEQLAYFLYLYPHMEQWVSEELYEKVLQLALDIWDVNACNTQWYPVSNTNHDLYALQTVFGGLKGSQPPGHSIMPNLMMYEVALREGLGEAVAQRFFDAAYQNTEYLIGNDFDLTDPYYNKGQRMSEHITITGLSYFLEMYPDKAPNGLKEAIAEWAKANVARMDNLWDIRMAVAPSDLDKGYTYHTGSKKGQLVETTYWTGAAYAIADGQNPAPKNEPGNQAGLQAIAYAAARVLDGAEYAALRQDLEIMGVSAIDDLYGRNPTGLAAFYHFTRDFEGADKGWYAQHSGGNGRLGGCTAVIDGNAPEVTYPYAPENTRQGYNEGWVAYNTAWNDSLAYSSAAATTMSVGKTSGNSGESITITLDAPLNLDSSAVETAYVWVTDMEGKTEKVTVTENGADGTAFIGTYTLPSTTPYITVSYGIGLFEQSMEVTVSDFQAVLVTDIAVSGAKDLAVGEKVQLTAEVKPADATYQTVTWTSSDDSIAVVSSDGMVTAKSAGTVTITAKAKDASGVAESVTIKVSAAAPSGLTVTAPTKISIFGGTGKAEVTAVEYSDGTTKTDNIPATITYTSSDSDILAVSADGTLTPKAAGTVTITASATVEGRAVTGTAKVAVEASKTFDLLALYRDKAYTTDGVTASEITADGGQRLKLTCDGTGDRITFDLGSMPAGTYEITLNSKFWSSYGSWSFAANGEAVGNTVNFNDGSKNGGYHTITIGTATLEEGQVGFTFVSQGGKNLVPVSVTLKRTSGIPEPAPEPEVSISNVSRTGETVTVTGTSKNLEEKKVEVIVNGDLEQRYVAEMLDANGNWKCQFTLPYNGEYVIEASIRDYSDFSKIIQTVPNDNFFDVEGREVWGSTVTKGPDGLYYMVFSTWHKTQGFSNDWAIYSELGYATSTTPDGPFVYQGIALDAAYSNTTNTEPVHWDGVGDLEVFHNPTMFRSEKDGKYYLYFMGTNATEGGYTYAYGRNHQRIGVAYADTPAGPWTVVDHPVIDVREGMFDSLLVSNPSVTEVKNADGTYTYYTVYKGVYNPNGTPLKGDVVVSGCGKASSPLGPFERSEEPIMQNPTDGWSVEDCFFWSSNGKLYALAKDFKSYFTGVSGYPYSYALFESTDGMTDWAVSENALAFVTEIPWEKGPQKVSNLERAQIYLEDGIPFLLCCATTNNGQSPYSGNNPYNVQIPLLGVKLASDSETLTVTNGKDGTVDKATLTALVEEAENAQEALFTQEDWEMLTSALAAAKRILADTTATPEDVAYYTAQLQEKLDNQTDPGEIPVNIVLKKPAEGTNTYTHSAAGEPVSGYEPDKAVDGDGSTRWATQKAGTESILTIDLQGTYRIDSFKITQYKGTQDGTPSRIASYSMEYYDGTEWKSFASGTGSATVIAGTLDTPVYGEKIRLILGDDTTIAPSINELEVYGVPHTHSPIAIGEGKEPTCTEPGLTEGKKCSVCGAILEAQKEIPALGHDYVTTTVEPTVEAEGYDLHTCKRCGHSYKDNFTDKLDPTIPPLPGHAISVVIDGNGTVTVDPKRAEAGETVTITATPDAGYEVDSITVTSVTGETVAVSDNRFTMPDCSVKVEVTFRKTMVFNPFVDVKNGDWYYKEVLWTYENDVMDGVGGGKFAPNGSVTRAMVWTVLARMDDQVISGSDWMEQARAWAMAEGVSDGTMATGNVTREQLATMLYRYLGSPAVSGSLTGYPDTAKVSDWAENAMIWATENGIINGMDGKLNPQGGATRAQLAAMLMRFDSLEK